MYLNQGLPTTMNRGDIVFCLRNPADKFVNNDILVQVTRRLWHQASRNFGISRFRVGYEDQRNVYSSIRICRRGRRLRGFSAWMLKPCAPGQPSTTPTPTTVTATPTRTSTATVTSTKTPTATATRNADGYADEFFHADGDGTVTAADTIQDPTGRPPRPHGDADRSADGSDVPRPRSATRTYGAIRDAQSQPEPDGNEDADGTPAHADDFPESSQTPTATGITHSSLTSTKTPTNPPVSATPSPSLTPTATSESPKTPPATRVPGNLASRKSRKVGKGSIRGFHRQGFPGRRRFGGWWARLVHHLCWSDPAFCRSLDLPLPTGGGMEGPTDMFRSALHLIFI